MILTDEQSAALRSRGNTIVSASAGSGKTFVMIEKLVGAVADGVDLDDVLAVTFTKKAAAQMKEKLRAAIIARIENAGEEKARLKAQLSKITSANISTIHSFCARLLRTYFYALDIDAGFDIISADDAVAKDLKARAMDSLFERKYAEGDKDFKLLLNCFMRKRNDLSLRRLVSDAYSEVRSFARYDKLLSYSESLYSEEGFLRVCKDFSDLLKDKFAPLICAVERFRQGFYVSRKGEVYARIFDEMENALKTASESGIFGDKPPLSTTRKPVDCAEDKEAGERFRKFREGISKRYAALRGDFADRQVEYGRFIESGKAARAFSRLLVEFDREYALVKAQENKLDYNDLEHFTLRLLADEGIKEEINSAFRYVYVDEYQDVNPVQEEIISSLTGETFLVGDVKQAIYGFRGSKSVFFSQKYDAFGRHGAALKLTSNFRSSDGVLNFVNKLFGKIMRADNCGIGYAGSANMAPGGGYSEGYGSANLHIFGGECEEEPDLGVYSVKADGRKSSHTREGLAVLSIVEKELKSKHYDLKSKCFVDTQPGDICILTRKNKGESTEGIVRALTDEGYPVAGAQENNICNLPEVKQMLDILSLIDNEEQDVPLVSALLSPLGGFCEDELAEIRIAFSGSKEKLSFRKCCEKFAPYPTATARKLNIFRGKLQKLRSLAGIVSVGELIDELLENYSLEEGYGAGGEIKIKNVLRLAEEGANLTLTAFLQKIKAGGYSVSSPAPAAGDSIKIMSMHASKGLEFPVVIIADVCKTFKGADYGEMPLDEVYGFAPKCYDTDAFLCHKTVLRRLVKMKSDAEELKNELNLFYVACTRAMCNLHILAEEIFEYDESSAAEAKCYADLIDFSKFNPDTVDLHPEPEESGGGEFITSPDENIVKEIEKRFMQPYPYKDSVDLPVKSSASAILRLSEKEPYFAQHILFDGEGETGTERGTAYHRFLELCDFAASSLEEVEKQKTNFLNSGRITVEQYALLDGGELSQILQMDVFKELKGAHLLREQEFLCRLPAKEVMKTDADDGVLIQGAIDLLATGDFGVKIIDYKYSHKPDGLLKEKYAPQLKLYKKAVSLVTGTSEDKISTVIVNIFLRRQIDMD